MAQLKILQGVFASSGGVRVHVQALAGELARQGHSVHTFEIGAEADGVPITYGPVSGLRAQASLDDQLRRTDPDVVHLHCPNQVMSPVLVKHLRTSRPTVATWHDVRPFCFLATRRFARTGEVCTRVCGSGCVTSGCYRPQGLLDVARVPRRVALDAWAMREFRALPRVIVVSRYLEQLAVQHGFAPDRVALIPSFVDAVPQPPDQSDPAEPLILFVGRLVPEKGGQVLLDALHQLKQQRWRAELVGDGPERETLAKRAQTLGLGERVRFTGYLDGAARDARITRASLVVFPTLIPEGLGLVGLEALRSGKPVVSFGLGGQRDWLIDGETGLLAREGDVGHLAAQIRALLEQPDRARTLGANGRELVEQHFRGDRCVPKIVDVYRAAMRAE